MFAGSEVEEEMQGLKLDLMGIQNFSNDPPSAAIKRVISLNRKVLQSEKQEVC